MRILSNCGMEPFRTFYFMFFCKLNFKLSCSLNFAMTLVVRELWLWNRHLKTKGKTSSDHQIIKTYIYLMCPFCRHLVGFHDGPRRPQNSQNPHTVNSNMADALTKLQTVKSNRHYSISLTFCTWVGDWPGEQPSTTVGIHHLKWHAHSQ